MSTSWCFPLPGDVNVETLLDVDPQEAHRREVELRNPDIQPWIGDLENPAPEDRGIQGGTEERVRASTAIADSYDDRSAPGIREAGGSISEDVVRVLQAGCFPLKVERLPLEVVGDRVAGQNLPQRLINGHPLVLLWGFCNSCTFPKGTSNSGRDIRRGPSLCPDAVTRTGAPCLAR